MAGTDEHNIIDGKPPLIFRRAECIVGKNWSVPDVLKQPEVAPAVAELIDRILEVTYYSDPMTKLPSGARFQEVMIDTIQQRAANASRAPCTLAYCDLNGFKNYNSAITKDGTDLLVREVAKILRKNAKHGNREAFVARPYKQGDEFLIKMDGYTMDEAVTRLRQINNEIANKMRFYHSGKNKSIENVTFSYGCVPLPTYDTPEILNQSEADNMAQQLKERAEAQMEKNKRLMKNPQSHIDFPDLFPDITPRITEGRPDDRPDALDLRNNHNSRRTIVIDGKERNRNA